MCFNHPTRGEEREKGREEQHQWVCLLVLLSCNINPLKQIRTDKHTSRGEQTEHTLLKVWIEAQSGEEEKRDGGSRKSRQSGSEALERWLRLKEEHPE